MTFISSEITLCNEGKVRRSLSFGDVHMKTGDFEL